jgi:hypothetical protein
LLVPVFAIVLAAVFFVGHFYLALAEVRASARRCAFTYAAGGCADVPPDCPHPQAQHRRSADDEAATLSAAVAQNDVFGVLSHIPLLGDAIDALFGASTGVRVERDIALPWQRGAARAVGTTTVSCNERPRDVAAAIRQVFCDRLPLLDCKDAQ